MTIEKKPFVNYRLDEEKGKPDIFTVRVNKTERLWLNESKDCLNINRDSTALKLLAEIGKNVILRSFGAKFMKFLTSEKRIREEVDTVKNQEK